MKIGYQGIEGSNSEEVAKIFAERLNLKNVSLIPLVNSENVVNELKNNNIDYGVMATNNKVGGIVKETADALEGSNLNKLLEDSFPIHHCLFIKSNIDINNITTVASHEQALKQTASTRQKLYPNWIEQEVEDTAIAARYLSEGKLSENTAVVCKKSAGEMFSLKLVKENIEDLKDNFTDFGIWKK